MFLRVAAGPLPRVGRLALLSLSAFLAIPCIHGGGAVLAAECLLEEDKATSVVAKVIDGDTLVLEDGREVRLTGIQAPKLPLGRPNFDTWPLAGEARDAVAGIALGKPVMLRFGGARIDRHMRVLAQVFVARDEGGFDWLQKEMLERGLARVYTFSDNRACSRELLEAERAARGEGRGIWADPFYGIHDAADVAGLLERVGRFELVEGRVASAALVRGKLYLNFGDDYRKDFTVTVQERDVKLFGRDEPWGSLLGGTEATDVSALAGRHVRVRGWLDRYNGPEMEATHPEQIEFTGDAD
ncbi:MAG: thermonuclease family protein [Parvibaculum sp.]|uniref:thermonuclease family protein n=1 Tax=Parvibaculum sp. TaxID=2024848 RepID=UPI002ABB7ECC|nr:thermonuclease family protein [Parvibaculum sp.]MDZ4381972.1 thermonuclease family protein [Parvibaculum sp.]